MPKIVLSVLLILALIISCILILYFYSSSFNNSHQNDASETTTNKNLRVYGKIDNSLENLRRILDFSFAGENAVYFSSQEIYSPDSLLNTYSFVYYRSDNTVSAPTLEDLMQSSVKSAELKSTGQELMKKAVESSNNELAQQAAGMLVEADRQLTQEDRFYTIEISKDFSMPPVVLFHPGIPEWIINRGKALNMAEAYFKDPGQIIRIERNVIGTPIIYVIINSLGDTAFVDPRNDMIYNSRVKATKKYSFRKTDQVEDENRKKRITTQWNDFLNNGVNIETFSLKGLKDLGKKSNN